MRAGTYVRYNYYVQLVEIKRDWMRVPNLKFWSFSLKGGVEAGRAHSCTLAHTHSNSIILTTMQAIDKALKDLASQESPNYGATVRKYSINYTTLLR